MAARSIMEGDPKVIRWWGGTRQMLSWHHVVFLLKNTYDIHLCLSYQSLFRHCTSVSGSLFGSIGKEKLGKKKKKHRYVPV